MGIRDISFFDWTTVDLGSNLAALGESVLHQESNYYGMDIDSSGTIYVAGKIRGEVLKTELSSVTPGTLSSYWVVKKSIDDGVNWEVVDFFPNGGSGGFSQLGGAGSVLVDPNDWVYIGGAGNPNQEVAGPHFTIRRSKDRGSTWETVFISGSEDISNDSPGSCRALHWAPLQRNVSGPDGRIFAGGGLRRGGTAGTDFFVISSQTGDSGSWSVELQDSASGFEGSEHTVLDIQSAPSSSDINSPTSYTGSIYLTLDVLGIHALRWNARSGSVALGTPPTWDWLHDPVAADFNGISDRFAVDPVNNVLWYTANNGDDQFDVLKKASTNKLQLPSQFSVALTQSDSFQSFWTSTPFYESAGNAPSSRQVMDFASNGDIYFTHHSGNDNVLVVKRYNSVSQTDFVAYDHYLPSGSSRVANEGGVYPEKIKVNNLRLNKFGNPDVYVVGQINDGEFQTRAFIRKGASSANSASLGARMLATSFGYVASEISGTTTHKFKLNNVSEYPHAGGLFQIPSMVLGFQQSGKIGNTEESIIQVRHFGSVVRVFWPEQKQLDTTVLSFGDASAGERAGKLTTNFIGGEVHDVTKFDHLALYCYLRKQVSGTLDDVEIRIERRPLKNTGFAIDQAIEYETSGSVTVAKLRDVVYKKEINYGDLSMREIGFPIDVPLSNVKEVRISCKHTIGQADEKNQNFIVWGRLIKSEEET